MADERDDILGQPGLSARIEGYLQETSQAGLPWSQVEPTIQQRFGVAPHIFHDLAARHFQSEFQEPPPEQERLHQYMHEGAQAGVPWEQFAPTIQSRFNVNPEPLHPAYEQGHGMEMARREVAFQDESVVGRIGRRGVPFLSGLVVNPRQAQEYTDARRRYDAGIPQPDDYHTIANYERNQQVAQERGAGGQLIDTALGMGAMVGEFALTRRAASGLGGLAGRGAAAMGATGGAIPLAAYSGQLAAQTALVPSFYAQGWIQENQAAGRDAMDPRGLPRPFALGVIQNAIFSSLGHVGQNMGPLARGATVTGAGIAQSEAASLIAATAGLQSGYGFLQAGIDGQWGHAFQHLFIEAATFGGFAALHETAPRLSPIQSLASGMREMARNGVPRDAAVNEMQRAADLVNQAIAGNPNLTREQARIALDRLPDGPAKRFGMALAETLGGHEIPQVPEAPQAAPQPEHPIQAASRAFQEAEQALTEARRRYEEEYAKGGDNPRLEPLNQEVRQRMTARDQARQQLAETMRQSRQAGQPASTAVEHPVERIATNTAASDALNRARSEGLPPDTTSEGHTIAPGGPPSPPGTETGPGPTQGPSEGLARPESRLKNVSPWLQETIEQLAASVNPKVADRIEDLSAERKTAKQIATELGLIAEQVSAVRAVRRIPSWTTATNMGGAAVESPEFTQWLAARQARAPESRLERLRAAQQPVRTPEQPTEPPRPVSKGEELTPEQVWDERSRRANLTPLEDKIYREVMKGERSAVELANDPEIAKALQDNGLKANHQNVTNYADRAHDKMGESGSAFEWAKRQRELKLAERGQGVVPDDPSEATGLHEEGSRLDRELEEGEKVIKALLDAYQKGMLSDDIFADTMGRLQTAYNGRGTGEVSLERYIKQLNAARAVIAKAHTRAKGKPAVVPGATEGQAPVSAGAGAGIQGGTPGHPSPVEGARPSAEGHAETPPAPAGGGQAHSDVLNLNPPPPDSTQRRMAGIHASGDETAWRHAKEAMRRNYPGEATEQFIQSLGKQTITTRHEPTTARGRQRQLGGEERHWYEDQEMEHERIEHEQRLAAEAGHTPAEIAGAIQDGLQAGQAEGKNAGQRAEAETPAPREAARPPSREAGEYEPGERIGPEPSGGGGARPEPGTAADVPFRREPRPGEQRPGHPRGIEPEAMGELPMGMGAAGGGRGETPPPPGAPGASAPQPPEVPPTPTASTWFQRARDWLKSFAGQAFPGLTRLARRSGEKLAEAANAPAAAKSTWEYMSRILKVNGTSIHDMKPEDRRLIGATWLEWRMRTFRDYLRSQGEDASNVRTLVGQEGSPLQTEADYQQARDALWGFFEGVKQEWTPEVERNYRGLMDLEPDESINARSQIPQLPLNAIALTEADIGKPGVVGTGRSQSLQNVRLRRPGFTRAAELDAPAYDIDVGNMMQRTLNLGIPAARRAEFVRQALADRVITATTGREKPPAGFQALELDPARGIGLDPNARYYAHPDAFRDIVQGLGIGERPGQTLASGMKPIVDKVSSVALVAPVELLTHISNHFTALFKSGMGIPILNLKDSFTNAFRLWRGDPEMYRKVMDLAKIGASFGHEARGGLLGERLARFDPTAYINRFTAKFIDTMQKAVRVQLGDAYDRTETHPTETGKRDFINQALGNYNNHANNRLTQFLKDIGMQPFATAAHTFTSQGIRTLAGGLNLRSETWGRDMQLRAISAMKLMPFLAMGPIINYLRWGQAFPQNVPAFAIKTGEDEDKTRSFDPLRFTGLRRGARATGINALVEHAIGSTDRNVVDQAIRDGVHSLAHLFQGPAYQFGHTFLTGENAMGHRVAPQVSTAATPRGIAAAARRGAPEKGSSQYGQNLWAALLNVNPLVGTFTEADRPRMPRTLTENVFQSLGPFGERSRQNQLTPAQRRQRQRMGLR